MPLGSPDRQPPRPPVPARVPVVPRKPAPVTPSYRFQTSPRKSTWKRKGAIVLGLALLGVSAWGMFTRSFHGHIVLKMGLLGLGCIGYAAREEGRDRK